MLIHEEYVRQAERDAPAIALLQFSVAKLNEMIIEAARNGLNIQLETSGPAMRNSTEIPGSFETLKIRIFRC